MPPDSENLNKLLGSKTVEKLYDDAVSPPAKELSKVGVDLVKTARLILAPLQITAAFQDRFERFVDKLRKRVPEERYIEPPAEIVGPSLEQMKYLDEGNPLWQMFEELLICSADRDNISNAHPSFRLIITQLSSDEARILFHLLQREFEIVDTMDLNAAGDRFENRKIEKSDAPANELNLPDKFDLYFSHLESLRVRSRMHTARYSAGHELDHGGLYEGEACFGEAFEIFCQPAIYPEPCESSLDHPTLW